MFGRGDLKDSSTDSLEQRLIVLERTRSRLAADEMVILEELDRRQVATGDGCKSLSEWVAARLDVSLDTARPLVRTMRRTASRSDLREALADGDVSFDRIEAVSKIPENVGLLTHLVVAGVCREAAKRVRLTAEDESRSLGDSYLVLQPSLDESWWKLWGRLDGHMGPVVDRTLTEHADSLPDLPDATRGSGSWRKAMALADVCMGGDARSNQVTVFVDAAQAAGSNGEAGVVLEAGPG